MGGHQGKMHFHSAIAYETRGKTRRGNPNYYIFTLDCGHKVYKYHNIHNKMNAFCLAVILPDHIKKGKPVTKDLLPKMHCYECARGQPHTAEAMDVDKFIEELNAKIKEMKEKAQVNTVNSGKQT